MDTVHKDLFCTQCSLQFDGSFIYGRHLDVVHNEPQSSKNDPKRKDTLVDGIDGVFVAKPL